MSEEPGDLIQRTDAEAYEWEKRQWCSLPGESVEQYLERVAGWDDATLWMHVILDEEFGVPPSRSKGLILQSRSFWERFFHERMTGPHKFGLSRAWGKSSLSLDATGRMEK